MEEQRLGDSIIDFIYKKGDKLIGVEVKGNNSDIIKTIGQLSNYYLYISHISLLAPKKFLNKFIEKVGENKVLRKLGEYLGLLTLVGDKIITLKEPTNEKYYAYITKKRPKIQSIILFDEIDKFILKTLTSPLTFQLLNQLHLSEASIKNKLSKEGLRKRLYQLEKLGFIKRFGHYPIFFVAKKIPTKPFIIQKSEI
jgi:hypothetical protein